MNVYELGAHSQPTAICTNISPKIQGTLKQGTDIFFTTVKGDEAEGSVADDRGDGGAKSGITNWNGKDLNIKYQVSPERVGNPDTFCYMGGLLPGMSVKHGCIDGTQEAYLDTKAPIEGKIEIEGKGKYTASCYNRGLRTLQVFSTRSEKLMWNCPSKNKDYYTGCPYTSYVPYYEYYGTFDYGNRLAIAAVNSENTDFTNGNQDFRGVDAIGRSEFFKKTTAYINAWMYAIREFEDAIDDCSADALTDNSLSYASVHAWDEGVAFFVGSELRVEDLGEPLTLKYKGCMAYTLGNKRCADFRTCGAAADQVVGESNNNIQLFQQFRQAQENLRIGDCGAVIEQKDKVVNLMTIPLVQGTLRYIYKLATYKEPNSKEQAEAAVFAAAVLPQVHACSAKNAQIIYDATNMKASRPDYAKSKKAFEQCYKKMGITCSEVGGIYDKDAGEYQPGASPCTDSGEGLNGGAIAGIVIASVIGFILLLALLFLICKEKKGQPVFYSVDPSTTQAAK